MTKQILLLIIGIFLVIPMTILIVSGDIHNLPCSDYLNRKASNFFIMVSVAGIVLIVSSIREIIKLKK